MRKARKVQKLAELGDLPSEYDVIAIDEGQFFTDVVLSHCRLWNSAKFGQIKVKYSWWLLWMLPTRENRLVRFSNLLLSLKLSKNSLQSVWDANKKLTSHTSTQTTLERRTISEASTSTSQSAEVVSTSTPLPRWVWRRTRRFLL